MRKRDELSDPKSCLNKADEHEILFILLGRDDASPDTIRYWIQRRIELGKNSPGDSQLVEAESWARAVERENATGV